MAATPDPYRLTWSTTGGSWKTGPPEDLRGAGGPPARLYEAWPESVARIA